MTDLTPNDLSHLSDEAFEALCTQGYHAPGPEPLSPAAQAVLDAYRSIWLDEPLECDVECLAAALRAAADQVVPANGSRKNNEIRAEVLTIAAELEGSND
jgi:hypothetical protein